ncbi:MAG: hydantoinase/oxoprolinase family protein [Gaiellales bacterium]
MSETRTFRVGIDIGGTFTDFTVVDDAGSVFLWKEDTTPDDPTRAIMTGLAAVADVLDTSVERLLQSTSLFVHGTTAATNAVIQRNGPAVGLLCTEGFRDILYFRNGYKPDRFNIHLQHPVEFVPRHLRLGVPERILRDGSIHRALDEDAVRAAADVFRTAKVQAVAIAFLWSIVNGAHELRAAELLRQELPGVHVLTSAEVLPEIREWERTSATVLSAYILPVMSAYMRRLEGQLAERGLGRSVLIMQINGGCASVDEVLRRPVNTLHSGPAAAPAAAAWYAKDIGADDLITIDMGGTSFDVCVIAGGRPSMSRTIEVDGQPVGVPGVEVESIGAGGGSIAWVDSGGALRVGPRSAGAVPGPACYGAGGTAPTVTDANVVLGYLHPDAFLGGRRQLRADLSEEAIRREVADPLGVSVIEAAAGIIRVVNSNMLGAIRSVSVERGVDPRHFTLVAGGGAGGIHAASLARALGMQRVLVPLEAGTFCAFGMTVTDVRHDHARALRGLSGSLAADDVTAVFAELEGEARERLLDDGFPAEQIELHRSVDVRYLGQIHELTIPIPTVAGYGPEEMLDVEKRFHTAHATQFGYSREAVTIEFLHWRVTGLGRMPVAETHRLRPDKRVISGASTRDVYFEEASGFVSTAIHRATELEPGALISGPAVIEASSTTLVVNPGDALTVRENGSYVIDVAVHVGAGSQIDAQLRTGA